MIKRDRQHRILHTWMGLWVLLRTPAPSLSSLSLAPTPRTWCPANLNARICGRKFQTMTQPSDEPEHTCFMLLLNTTLDTETDWWWSLNTLCSAGSSTCSEGGQAGAGYCIDRTDRESQESGVLLATAERRVDRACSRSPNDAAMTAFFCFLLQAARAATEN